MSGLGFGRLSFGIRTLRSVDFHNYALHLSAPGHFEDGHCAESLGHRTQLVRHVGLGTVRILSGWALQRYSAVGMQRHSAKIIYSWALRGTAVVGQEIGLHRNFLLLGIAGILCHWALQGHSAVVHGKDVLRLGTAWIICCEALQVDYNLQRLTVPLQTKSHDLTEWLCLSHVLNESKRK